MATSLGVASGADGNLYELFSDGSRVLKEAGYQKRIDAMVSSQGVNTASTSTVSATPPTPSNSGLNLFSSSFVNPVKTSIPDNILFDDDSVPIELMTDLIFENIGGHELINIARNDTVNGQFTSYQLIKNLSDIEQQYNANNILSLQSTSDKYFNNFSIKLDQKVPISPTGPDQTYVYLDIQTGDIIVESVNLDVDEQVEIQLVVNGTIYEGYLDGEES
jgi:hypothetical protein